VEHLPEFGISFSGNVYSSSGLLEINIDRETDLLQYATCLHAF
jgi:hypothetical protein